jgi:hypothetical protein
MTTRDSLLERLERANPVPDPSLLYEDVETSSQIELTEQQRREIMIETSFKPSSGGEDPRSRRGLLVGFAAVAILIGLLAFLSRSESDVAEAEIRPGPVSSFEAIAGTYQRQGLGGEWYFQFFEDGTIHVSQNRDFVEDHPQEIIEAAFEGTKVFVTTNSAMCSQPDQGGTYEIHVLENGNLQFLAFDEDTCGGRSFWKGEQWEPVP